MKIMSKVKFQLFFVSVIIDMLFSFQPLMGQECTEKSKLQNDEFFPSAPAAVAAINFDGRGFIVNGKRTFITSGSIHYSRVPRENWRDILLKLKRSGFNTVETYIFWNYHESVEGKYDFTSENRDFGAFLDIAKDLGLYAIVRVGPYVCAEWENGGYPNWLSYKHDLEIRKNNEQYIGYVTSWFNKIMPMITKRQIYKGGNVIMVQLENEMPVNGWKCWGRTSDGLHMDKLMELAKKNGLEVPMIFSGIHHAHNPAPDKPIDVTKRTSPWMSMELWTIWFDRYGNSGNDLIKGERSAWRILSQGGAGFNLYMFHGGTTFGYYNFSNDIKYGDDGEKGTACYDFGTLVGQTGDTRELYNRLKRLAYQAETFSPILANSMIDTVQYKDFAKGVYITSRKSPDGTFVFLNNKSNDTTVVLKNGISVKLAAKEIAAFAMDVEISKGIFLKESFSRILGIVKQKNITTIVCYGDTGNIGKLVFNKDVSQCQLHNNDINSNRSTNNISFSFPTDGTKELFLNIGKKRIRLLLMNKDMADKTWFVDTSLGRQIIVGAPYLGEFSMKSSGKFSAEIEYPITESVPQEITIYGNGSAQVYKLPKSNINSPIITLNSWSMALLSPQDSCSQDEKNWFSLSDGNAPELGMNNNNSPYAWYKTRLKNDSTVTSLLFRKIGDRATFFIDGKEIAEYDYKKDKITHIPINIQKGEHELSVFVAHAGRRKFSGYVGPINTIESQKGLCGPIFAEQPNSFISVRNWQMKGGVNPFDSNLKWTKVIGSKLFPAYFKTQFMLDEQPVAGIVYRLTTNGLSFGCVWLNGHNLGRYPELVKDCTGIWLPSCWMKKGINELIVFDEKGCTPEKLKVILDVNASRNRIKLND